MSCYTELHFDETLEVINKNKSIHVQKVVHEVKGGEITILKLWRNKSISLSYGAHHLKAIHLSLISLLACLLHKRSSYPSCHISIRHFNQCYAINATLSLDPSDTQRGNNPTLCRNKAPLQPEIKHFIGLHRSAVALMQHKYSPWSFQYIWVPFDVFAAYLISNIVNGSLSFITLTFNNWWKQLRLKLSFYWWMIQIAGTEQLHPQRIKKFCLQSRYIENR